MTRKLFYAKYEIESKSFATEERTCVILNLFFCLLTIILTRIIYNMQLTASQELINTIYIYWCNSIMNYDNWFSGSNIFCYSNVCRNITSNIVKQHRGMLQTNNNASILIVDKYNILFSISNQKHFQDLSILLRWQILLNKRTKMIKNMIYYC